MVRRSIGVSGFRCGGRDVCVAARWTCLVPERYVIDADAIRTSQTSPSTRHRNVDAPRGAAAWMAQVRGPVESAVEVGVELSTSKSARPRSALGPDCSSFAGEFLCIGAGL